MEEESDPSLSSSCWSCSSGFKANPFSKLLLRPAEDFLLGDASGDHLDGAPDLLVARDCLEDASSPAVTSGGLREAGPGRELRGSAASGVTVEALVLEAGPGLVGVALDRDRFSGASKLELRLRLLLPSLGPFVAATAEAALPFRDFGTGKSI
jgi:hypothetical protein